MSAPEDPAAPAGRHVAAEDPAAPAGRHVAAEDPAAPAGRHVAAEDRRPSSSPSFPFSYVDRVRYGDLDAMRHLNNVTFLQFFESARIAYLREVAPGHDPANPGRPDDDGLIFAEAHIRYASPGFYDEEIRTSCRIEDVRRSSFRVAFVMHVAHDERLLAEGWGAVVGYDYRTGRAAPLSDALRARLEAEAARCAPSTPPS